MNRIFPYNFTERQLRVYSQIGWIHATAMYANGIRSCVKPTYPAGFTQLGITGWGLTKRVFTQLRL